MKKKLYILIGIMFILISLFIVINQRNIKNESITEPVNKSMIEEFNAKYILDYYSHEYLVGDSEVTKLDRYKAKQSIFLFNDNNHIIKGIMDINYEEISLEHTINGVISYDTNFNYGPTFGAGYENKLLLDSNAPKSDSNGTYTSLNLYNIENFTFQEVGRVDNSIDFVQNENIVYIPSYSRYEFRNNIFKFDFITSSLEKILLPGSIVPNTVLFDFDRDIIYGLFTDRPLGENYSEYRNKLTYIENGKVIDIRSFDFKINNAIVNNNKIYFATKESGIIAYDPLNDELYYPFDEYDLTTTKIFRNNDLIILANANEDLTIVDIYEFDINFTELRKFTIDTGSIESLKIKFSF